MSSIEIVSGPWGTASMPPAEQRARALVAWDAFRDLAARTDLDAPSRLPGWDGRAVLTHLASWPEAPLLVRLLAEARGERAPDAAPMDQDDVNARLVDNHRDATREELLAALDDGRARLAAAFDATTHEPALALARTGSQVGPVPLLTQLGAIAYELAVHALDLDPAAPAEPAPELLDAGLLALADITGALAARHGVRARTGLAVPGGGWGFAAPGTAATGWEVFRLPPGRPNLPAVEARSAALLLDASAGRRAVPALLARRDLKPYRLPGLLALAPLLDHVPGLPGGPALRLTASALGGVGRVAALLPALGRAKS
ncbi:maleylpyruvate isomerase N-terminal domain-containing protein [Embleya sp. NBC_00896]|uniref:maleylpyruvate isomerase N-terminal domain-containing protein n=1 Tax=Embleya sp. NBC_00896 TaxID=2975961 RepID=UPI0038665C30|nr:maleylpyruvate isomerase N-terminal domain-containing protein [Embleya sp. NBC_00896]